MVLIQKAIGKTKKNAEAYKKLSLILHLSKDINITELTAHSLQNFRVCIRSVETVITLRLIGLNRRSRNYLPRDTLMSILKCNYA